MYGLLFVVIYSDIFVSIFLPSLYHGSILHTELLCDVYSTTVQSNEVKESILLERARWLPSGLVSGSSVCFLLLSSSLNSNAVWVIKLGPDHNSGCQL